MNKLNIVNSENDHINGYENIKIENINSVINGTCENIICSVLDSFSYKDRLSSIVTMCKKLSNMGSLTLRFIDGTRLCKDAYKGNVNSSFISGVLEQTKSIFLDSDITELVSQMQDINIAKAYNDNLYCIVILQKNL